MSSLPRTSVESSIRPTKSAQGGDRWRKYLLIGLCLLTVAGVWLGMLRPTAGSRGLSALLRLGLCMTASITMLFGPGVVLGHLRSRPLAISHLFLPGFALLGGTGALVWVLAERVRPEALVALVWTPLLVAMTLVVARMNIVGLFSRADRKALVLVTLVLLVAVGRGIYSQGPRGELYSGTISRTLEVGDRSDSRISYHVVQLVANGLDPRSEIGKRNFLPWSFSDRGPLAGLVVSPIVISSGAKIPIGLPDQPWAPFDGQGFAAYRIAMATLASALLLIAYGTLSRLSTSEWGLFSLLVLALTPFLVHEIYFTWPKLLAAGFVLLAADALIRYRGLSAGVYLGIGYLVHPLALLSVPSLFFGAFLVTQKPRFRWDALKTAALQLGLLLFSLLFILLLWRAVNGDNFTQNRFLVYAGQAYGSENPSFPTWVRSRVDTVLNTLVPMHSFIFDRNNPAVNALGEASPGIIQFYFQYWNTLPFGVGILFYPFAIAGLLKASIKATVPFLAVVLIPFLLFALYWGTTTSGLLREGLHVWVVVVLLTFVWSRRSRDSDPSRVLRIVFGVVASSRAIEILLMMLLPTLLTAPSQISKRFLTTDVFALATMVLGVGALAWRAWLIGAESTHRS